MLSKQKDSMSNMHTLTHDNTFVIIQEIRAFHKIVVATVSDLQIGVGIRVLADPDCNKAVSPRPTFIDLGETAQHSFCFFC